MSSTRIKAPEPRVARAARYVSDHWLPVSPAALASIQKRDREGVYDKNLKALLSDLQQDANLFLYCVKELATSVKSEGTQVASPFEILERAGLEQLREILAVPSPQTSSHSLRGAHELQVQRIQESLVSTATTQALCSAQQIDEELGFAFSTMRQLGLSLICWNYPGLYERVAGNLRNGESLDQRLTEELGFSPQTLAATVLSSWGINPAVALDEDSDVELGDPIAKLIKSHCHVGETLARANNPQLYPTARTELRDAMTIIQAHLGVDGMSTIQKRFSSLASHVVESIPQLFKAGMVLDPEVRMATWHAQRVVDLNPLISRCRPFIRDRLMNLYERIVPGEASSDLCREIVRELLPLAGFQRGIVFGVNPLNGELVPQLIIREDGLHEPDPSHTERDIARRAFEQMGVITEGDPARNLYTLAYHLGMSHRVGVLQAVLPALAFEGTPDAHEHHLKALALAVTHCLGVA